MKKVIKCLSGAMAAFAAVFLVSSALYAEGHESSEDHSPAMTYIEWSAVDPAHEQEYETAWKRVREIASTHGYGHPTYMAQFRNQFYWFTPMNTYGDMDRIFAARQEIYEKAGEEFAAAIAEMNKHTVESRNWVSKHNKDLSYAPAGGTVYAEGMDYMDINIYHVKYGHGRKIEAVMKDIKDLFTDMEIDRGYDIHHDMVGGYGNNVVVITYGADRAAAAVKSKEIGDRLKETESWKTLFKAFQSHISGTDHQSAWVRGDLALLPQTEE